MTHILADKQTAMSIAAAEPTNLTEDEKFTRITNQTSSTEFAKSRGLAVAAVRSPRDDSR